MSSGRDSHDGSFFGRSIGLTEWGNSNFDKIKTDQHHAKKRSGKTTRKIVEEPDHFSEDADKDRYLITYADLITLLLGLFIIMYAMSNIDSEKYKSAVSALGNVFGNSTTQIIPNGGINPYQFPIVKRNTLKRDLQNVISDNKFDESVQLIESERGIIVRILDKILFPSGSADLTEQSQKVLSEIARILKESPNDLRIEGHTDNVPINSALFPSNWHLSINRALNTAYFLMSSQGLPQDKVSVVGLAEYKPIAENNSVEGRQQNRRVDIVILNK